MKQPLHIVHARRDGPAKTARRSAQIPATTTAATAPEGDRSRVLANTDFVTTAVETAGESYQPHTANLDALSQAPQAPFGVSLLGSVDAGDGRARLELGALAIRSDINNADWQGQDLGEANGGTGASSFAAARANMSLYSVGETNAAISDAIAGKAVRFDAGQGLTPAQQVQARGNIGAQVAGAYQAQSGNLSALAGLTLASDKLVYATGAGALAAADLSPAARTLVAQSTQALMRSAGLGLGGLSTLSTSSALAWTGAHSFAVSPTAPTPATTDNSTKAATTAWGVNYLASLRGAAGGLASLGADGKLVTAQLPALAITDAFAVASQTAMLALAAERGDVAIRSDLNKSFILAADNPAVLANWLELKTPTDAVTSVAARTGAVVLTSGDLTDVSPAARTLLGQSTQALMRSTGLGLGGLATLSTNSAVAWTGAHSHAVSPTAPTPAAADSSTKAATTAFVHGAVGAKAVRYDAVQALTDDQKAQARDNIGVIRSSLLDLSQYIDQAAALSDEQIAAYPDKSGWTDVSPALRQAFADAGDRGLVVSPGALRGNFFIDPDEPVLVRTGSGYQGGDFVYPTLSYVNVGDELKDVILGGGVNFIVDPLSAHRKVPKFALQGTTRTEGLSIVGVGLAGSDLLDVTDYPTIHGAEEFFTDAPVIVTDHQHLGDGSPALQDPKIKAGGLRLNCSVLGLMQCVYIGDPHPSEEPWSGKTASGMVTGTGGNDIEIHCGPTLRALGMCRKTSTSMKVRIQLNQPRWTGVTQPLSGGRFDMSWIKLVQQCGRGVDAWHRAVGFDWDLSLRGVRYGVYLQAGYSPEGPDYAPPAPNTAVAVGDVISGTDGNVFTATTAGAYTTRPVASGPNYLPAKGLFSDPGSSLCWTFQCRKQDTGKYNSGKITVEGERIIQPIYVHVNAYMHNVDVSLKGHFMDEYNLDGECGPAVEVRSHRLIAGAIDKAVYKPWVAGQRYDYKDKISDANGDVWSVISPGTSTTVPDKSKAVDGVFSDGDDLKWHFRSHGWKPFGDIPFARVAVTGAIQEISGPLFKNTSLDGHKIFAFDEMTTGAWSQSNRWDALIQNLSPATAIKHGGSQTFASGKSNRVYDVANPDLLFVEFNQYHGYDLADRGGDPAALTSGLPPGFFRGKNCTAHELDAPIDDDDLEGDD